MSLAGQIFDTLSDKTVMLMGAGKMAELTARQLNALGTEIAGDHQRALSTVRSRWRASSAAPRSPSKTITPYLQIADIVIGSLSADATGD